MKNENNKIKNKWFLVAAICYYISAMILFISKNNTSMAGANLCLGSCMLCLAISDNDKDKKSKK